MFLRLPQYFLYSGNASNSDINTRGSSGYYWSSSTDNTRKNYAYYLGFDSSSLRPGTSSLNKYLGPTVRCVASS